MLSMLRRLKADHILDKLSTGTPSLLTSSKDIRVDERTKEQEEKTKRMLEDTTIEQYIVGPLSGANLLWPSSEISGESRTSDSTEGCRLEGSRAAESTNSSSITALGAIITSISTVRAIPSLSAFDNTRTNSIMHNASAMGSVQSFYSAVSHLEHASEDKSPHQKLEEDIARAAAKHFYLSGTEATTMISSMTIPNVSQQRQDSSTLHPIRDPPTQSESELLKLSCLRCAVVMELTRPLESAQPATLPRSRGGKKAYIEYTTRLPTRPTKAENITMCLVDNNCSIDFVVCPTTRLASILQAYSHRKDMNVAST